MTRNEYFFQVTMSYILRHIYICDLFTDSSSYIALSLLQSLRK
jgi:hypothetical protein